jgi:hypothetical protein
MVDKTSGTKWLMTWRNIALSGLELLIGMEWSSWGLMRSMLPVRCFLKSEIGVYIKALAFGKLFESFRERGGVS